jgi:hypothetical protein
MERIIHILFDEAGAKNLQAAFAIDPTLEDAVVVMEDDWSAGPLTDMEEDEERITRASWLQHHLATDSEEPSAAAKDQEKLQDILEQLQQDDNLHIWIWAAQNTRDVCGYYWLLQQVQAYQGRVEMIYLNNLPFLNEKAQLFFPLSLSEIPPKEFPKAKRLAREITPSEIEVDTEEWQLLMNEPSLLRVLEGAKKIKPQPADACDADILRQCRPDWQKAGRVLQQLAAKHKQIPGEAFLLWRIKELIAQGRLEYQGELKGKKDFEIKVAGIPAPADDASATPPEPAWSGF